MLASIQSVFLEANEAQALYHSSEVVFAEMARHSSELTRISEAGQSLPGCRLIRINPVLHQDDRFSEYKPLAFPRS